MTDIVERLRGEAGYAFEHPPAQAAMLDAADVIERLREIIVLREEIISQLLDNTHSHAVRRRAEAALKGGNDHD